VIVVTELAVAVEVICMLESVTSISAVAAHFQSVFRIELAADLEGPVLG